MSRDKGISVFFDREKNEFNGIKPEIIDSLKKSYPNKNIENELEKMKLWLLSKGKKRKGNLQFIMNWLGNSPKINIDKPISLDQLELEYLEEIWSKSQHLLVLNMKV